MVPEDFLDPPYSDTVADAKPSPPNTVSGPKVGTVGFAKADGALKTFTMVGKEALGALGVAGTEFRQHSNIGGKRIPATVLRAPSIFYFYSTALALNLIAVHDTVLSCNLMDSLLDENGGGNGPMTIFLVIFSVQA